MVRSMERQALIPAFPDEISMEILKKLPTKSLLRFSIISKTWNSTVSSKHFTKSHLLNSLSDPNYSHHHILFNTCYNSTTALHFPLPYVLHNPLPQIVPQHIPYPIQDLIEEEIIEEQQPSLIGSINGLVCIATQEPQLILWNPSTRKTRTLPNLDSQPACPMLDIVYGFGYDSSAQDYKVLAIFTVRNGKNPAFVYSQNTDSWNNIQGFNVGLGWHDSGKFVNGKLHWSGTVCYEKIDKSRRIIFIDVGDESYGELEHPHCGGGEFDSTLGVLGEDLCVLCSYEQVQVEFWVMKEYGVTESWTKFASLTAQNLDCIEISPYTVLLYVLNSGEILLLESGTFLLYNPKDRSTRSIYSLGEDHDPDIYEEACIYVESLVLP